MSAAPALPRLIDCAGIVRELGHYVYVLDTDYGVKVGRTFCLYDRVRDLSRGSGQHHASIRVVAAAKCATREESSAIESGTHWRLRHTRTVGEWFSCHPLEAKEALMRAVRAPVHFGRLHDWARAA